MPPPSEITDLDCAADATNEHYELPAEVFEAFLDRRMKYTCGLYTTGQESLDEAQEAKLHMIASLLGIRGGERVLDIGCGWGSLSIFLAEKYDCTVLGIAPARRPLRYLLDTARRKHLGDRVTVRNCSVYDLEPEGQRFDAVALVGVVEHMPDHDEVLRIAAQQLRRGGHLYLSASCYRNQKLFENYGSRPGSRQVTEGIFGYGVLRPVSMLLAAAEQAGFSISSLTDLTVDYRRTIEEWERRAIANWDAIDNAAAGLTEKLVRFFRTTNTGWGYTTKHYAFSALRSRQGKAMVVQ